MAMAIMDQIKQKAKSDKKTIVLAEGTEERTIKAAEKIVSEGYCDIILVGNQAEIEKKAAALSVNLAGVTIINPQTSELSNQFSKELYELRKEKGMTPEKADELIGDALYFGTMLVKTGKADGMVAGAVNSTGNVLRPALQILKTAKGIKVVSSCFIMEMPENSPGAVYGDGGVLIFADCAVIPNPSAEELAAIALASAATGKALCGLEPRIAMLSFSTKGSASHELADKVIEATNIAKSLDPAAQIDGELQADAALVDSVGTLKSPGSPVAGKANVLVFPDLQAGNIGYKLVQRLAGAEAVGPVIQGLAKPVNDLSRGCSVQDIVDVVAVTAASAV